MCPFTSTCSDPAHPAGIINRVVYDRDGSVLRGGRLKISAREAANLFDGFPGTGVERAGTTRTTWAGGMSDVFSAAALYQRAGYRVGEGAHAEASRR
jgi:hypothetical protein